MPMFPGWEEVEQGPHHQEGKDGSRRYRHSSTGRVMDRHPSDDFLLQEVERERGTEGGEREYPSPSIPHPLPQVAKVRQRFIEFARFGESSRMCVAIYFLQKLRKRLDTLFLTMPLFFRMKWEEIPGAIVAEDGFLAVIAPMDRIQRYRATTVRIFSSLLPQDALRTCATIFVEKVTQKISSADFFPR